MGKNGKKRPSPQTTNRRALAKAPTGMRGLDEITLGGLPRGRPTLVCGAAGSGKTLFAMEFVVKGATEFDEPGVFLAFEETPEELAQNVRSLGFDLDDLIARGKLAVDYVHIERSEIEETGEYDLEGLFIRLGYAIDSVGAKRVAIDTIETIFASLSNPALLRSELRRLFRWLKDRGVTVVLTGERGDGALTRQGLEEYVSDCVILLDHRVIDQVATRRLRIVKYRGSYHGTNEYPFLIDDRGFEVLPITSIGLDHAASDERVSTGIPRLDTMLGGEGLYRGSSVLISGTAGSGKSSMAASFARACCERGERCLYFAFEESPQQIVRNMRSIGIELQPLVDRGLLRFHAARPTLFGLETHLATMHRAIRDHDPAAVIVDPISNLSRVGGQSEVTAMLMRLVDWLKSRGVTALFTSLTSADGALEQTDIGVSSLIDTWFLVKAIESSGERNRGLYVLKSRGMAHSNQIREFLLTPHGIELQDVYLGAEGMLTGSARAAQEARERQAETANRLDAELRDRALEVRRKALEAQIAALQAELAAHQDEGGRAVRQEDLRREAMAEAREELARARRANAEEPAAPAKLAKRGRR